MENKIVINIGYSFTHYNKDENSFESIPTLKAVRDLLEGDECDKVSIRYWINKLTSEFQGEYLILIIPNASYENKTICKEIQLLFETVISLKTFNIISECEAIASYIISKNQKNGDYQVIDFGQTTIQVHRFKLINHKFYHCTSQNIQLDKQKSISDILNKELDPIFSTKSDNEFFQFLNDKHHELINSLSEDLDYPIVKGSKIYYNHLRNEFESLGKKFSAKLKEMGIITTNDTIYCGGKFGLLSFMYYALNCAEIKNDFRYSKIIGGSKWDNNMYPKTESDIFIKVFCPKENEFLLSQFSTETNSDTIKYLSSNLEKNKITVSLFNTKKFNKPITFRYGKKLLTYSIDDECLEALKEIPLMGNNNFQWYNLELGVSIDGCQNLTIHFSRNTKIIYSNIVDKI